MDRRIFLKKSFISCGSMALPVQLRTTAREGKELLAGRRIYPQYIRQVIPTFEIPPYRGRAYEDRVPNTLEVAEQAKLGIQVLTSITDPKADYEIYSYWRPEDFFRNPPVMEHDFNDWVQNQEGLMEALPLLRTTSGESMNSEVDPAWMKSILKSIGPDGLIYLPLEGRPWARLNASGMDPVWRADGTKTNFKDPKVTQAASAATSERAIGTMTVYYLRDKNPVWKGQIEKMIGRLTALAIDRGDYCYFPAGSFEPNAKIDPNAEMPRGSLWGTTWNSRLIQALAQYYTVTGYEPARSLAGKLTAYTRYHGEIFDPEGTWLMDPEIRATKRWMGKYDVEGLKFGGHGHGHGIALLSVLDYALATDDHDLLEFSNRGFNWVMKDGPKFGTSLLVGWFPEFFVPDYPSCEGCIVGDMISLAVKLSASSTADYWDYADRWVRNHFAADQLKRVDWIDKLAQNQPPRSIAWNETADRVPERNIGAWSGWAEPNDWGKGVSHCCTGTCTRTIYYVWEHMVDYKDRQLRVNLLMNRASRWADVYSYIPYEGRVDLKMKEECRSVRVRAPEWVNTGSPELACQVNGKAWKLGWEGRYVEVGAVKRGDKIKLTFPIAERTVKERIGPNTYTLVLKGNTVLSIDPPGENGPLYQDRAKYRKNEVAWAKVERFVPEQEIRW